MAKISDTASPQVQIEPLDSHLQSAGDMVKAIENPPYYINHSWQVGKQKKVIRTCLCMTGFAIDGMGVPMGLVWVVDP